MDGSWFRLWSLVVPPKHEINSAMPGPTQNIIDILSH